MIRSFHPLPAGRLILLEGWAMMARSLAYVYRPSTTDGLGEVLELARRTGRPVIARGSGFSYGDTSLNAENIVVETGRLNRVLDWNPDAGIIRIEPGVTIGQLWRTVLEDGWWPAVVPGTMFPTLGGCASTNVHGKNHWRLGSLGEQILSADLLLPSGESVTVSPGVNPELYFGAIAGLGLLGLFTSLTLRLAPVPSGLLRIEEEVAPDLNAMFDIFRQREATSDHLIGWIDGYASGSAVGRGIVQAATNVPADESNRASLRPAYQDLPDTLFGLVPRSQLWRLMRFGANDLGLRALNEARFRLAALRPGRVTQVPHAQFHFILDYVPNWKLAFRPGGIVQYQVFVPAATAPEVFARLLEGSQAGKQVPSLAVFKRHVPDPFLLSYSVDGYSLALDYHVPPGGEARLYSMLSRFTHDIVLPKGGHFYPAKDNSTDREALRESFAPGALDRFLALKARVDPEDLLQSDLYRRVFR